MSVTTLRIGILGSGRMGRALGRAWARRGHTITFSYARDQARLERIAKDCGHGARAGSPAQAADADVVLLSVPWARLNDLLEQAGPLERQVVLSCSLPMTHDDADLALGLSTSGAEELARRTGAHVVSAFNTIPSELIARLATGADAPGTPATHPHESDARPMVAYCGDDGRAKALCAGLIADAGFAAVDAGALRIARYLEPFGVLVGQLAYGTTADPALGYRFYVPGASDTLTRAD